MTEAPQSSLFKPGTLLWSVDRLECLEGYLLNVLSMEGTDLYSQMIIPTLGNPCWSTRYSSPHRLNPICRPWCKYVRCLLNFPNVYTNPLLSSQRVYSSDFRNRLLVTTLKRHSKKVVRPRQGLDPLPHSFQRHQSPQVRYIG